jgi:hypothetical protein
MKIKIFDEEFECARYEKNERTLNLYNESGSCIVSAGGISSFDGIFVDGVPIEDVPKEGGAK